MIQREDVLTWPEGYWWGWTQTQATS